MPAENELDNFSDPPLAAFQPSKDSYNLQQRALLLLAEGHLAARISQLLGLSQWNVYKIAKRAEMAGALVKESFFRPAIYTKGPTFEQLLSKNQIGQAFSSTKRKPVQSIATPHHFAAYYNIRNSFKPKGEVVKRRNWDGIKEETESLTAIWGTKTLTVWVKLFKKGSPQQKIKDGLGQVAEYVAMKKEAGAKLTFNRLAKRIEWMIEQEKLSEYLTLRLGLKESAKVIAKARWLPKDLTHDHVEVNKELGLPDDAATKAIKVLDYILDEEKFLASYALTRTAIMDLQEGIRLSAQRQNILEAELQSIKKKGV